MKNKRAKTLPVLLAAFTAAGMCGCGAQNAGESSAEPITFTFYNADGTEDPWTDPVAKKITQETGVTLKTEYPSNGMDQPYTCSDDGKCTRVNLYNAWVSKVPDEARVREDNGQELTPCILDADTLGNVETISVTFDFVAGN